MPQRSQGTFTVGATGGGIILKDAGGTVEGIVFRSPDAGAGGANGIVFLSGAAGGAAEVAIVGTVLPGVTNTAEHNGHLIDLPKTLAGNVRGFLQAAQATTIGRWVGTTGAMGTFGSALAGLGAGGTACTGGLVSFVAKDSVRTELA